jgi:cell fate (sporulation/competence/biofilm development) regulator YlbF (YheA/YmcA/DUF963 family)
MADPTNDVKDYQINTGVEVINDNTPTVHSKEQFSDYMNNKVDDGIYRPENINEIKIVQSVNNTDEKPENNIYEFRYSKDGQEHSLCKVIGKDNADAYFTEYAGGYFGSLEANVKKSVAVEMSINNITVKIKESLQDLSNDVLIKKIDDIIEYNIAPLRKNYNATDSKLTTLGLTKIEKNMIKLLRSKVDRDKKELNQLEDKLRDKKRDLEKWVANMDAQDNIEEVRRKVKEYEGDQNHIENFLTSGAALSSFMQDTPTHFERSPADKKAAEKMKKTFTKVELAQRVINNTLLDADMKKIMGDHNKSLYHYVNGVASGTIDPAEQPFTVDPNHVDGLNHIIQQEPSLATIVWYNDDKTTDENGKEIYVDPKSKFENTNTYTNSADYNSTKEAFEKWGVTWVIDHALAQTKMSSGQREFWWWTAKLAAIGWGIYLGWKFLQGTYKSIFGWEEGRKDGLPWMVGWLAAIMGSQMLTGRNARDVAADVVKWGPTSNWMANIFGGDKWEGGKTNTEVQANKDKLTYAQGFPAMAALFNGMKYSEIDLLVHKENGKLKLDIPLIKQHQRFKTAEMTKIVDFLDANQKQDVVDLALTGMGIDEDALKNNPDQLFNETAKDALDRVVNVYKAMEDGGYDVVSNEGLILVRQYIKTWSPSIDNLIGKGIFEKSDAKITATLSEPLKNIVRDKIQVNDKEQLTKSIKIFLESNKTAGLDIVDESGKLYINNYGKKTEVDFVNKKIENGGHKIVCDTYLELIRAATLTNFLKKSFADNSKQKQPFYEDFITADIKFDDGIWYKPDVDAVTAGKDRDIRWVNLTEGKLNKFIPALAANKKTYMAYLNSFDIRERKTK